MADVKISGMNPKAAPMGLTDKVGATVSGQTKSITGENIFKGMAQNSQTMTVGHPITPGSYAALSTNPTVDFTKPRGCTMANDASGIINLPTGDGEQVIYLDNGASPGDPDISAFTLLSGEFSSTPSTGRTRMYIEKYGSVAYIELKVIA